MKTKEPTQKNYDSPEEIRAENKDGNYKVLEIAATLALTCGFPFVLMISFTALAAFLTEKTLAEFVQQASWPAGILAAISIVSLPLALAFVRLSESNRRTGRKYFV